MKKTWKRLCTGFLALATVVTALPTTPVHAESKGQTITFKEKSEEPEKPETPPTPEKPNRPSDSPKTGDNTNLYGLLALLMTSGAGLAGIFFYKRRKMKKS